MGHEWAQAQAWGVVEATQRAQLKLRNHQDFPAAERGFSETLLASNLRTQDLSLDKP